MAVLPAYSPDLNLIEKMWSKVKQYLEAAKARTREMLLPAVSKTLRAICINDAQDGSWLADIRISIEKFSN